jgi:7-cyano-7-deazaguanine synthase|tara:strand:+ start:160 stop:858 length:699 start_codon:yes stop_codon:yes gene_type:complete
MKILQIYSGGMDSTALLYAFKKQGHIIETIWFDYGQKHKKEQLHAIQICKNLEIPFNKVDLTSLNAFLSNSSLSGDNEVPNAHYEDQEAISTIVPNRNMIMLSIASAKAINDKMDAIAFGCHYGDRVVYPDCRLEFTQALQTAISLADRHMIKLLTPFIDISKAEIVKLGNELNVPWQDTWTCYKGEELHCGQCPTCIERREAFYLVKINDPTIYQSNAPTTEELIKNKWRP